MLVQSQSDTHSNFINSIKSGVTKKIYEYNLRLFMEFCSVHQYEDLMDQENKIIPAIISKTIFPLFREYRELGVCILTGVSHYANLVSQNLTFYLQINYEK